MSIAPDSQSYPYLAYSQEHGVPYDVVLHYASFVEWKLKLEKTIDESAAGRGVPALKRHCASASDYRVVARQIEDVVREEHGRRAARRAAERAAAGGPPGRPKRPRTGPKLAPKGRAAATGPRGRKRHQT